MNCREFGELSDLQIKAVMQLTFQLIASANYGGITEKDDPSIDVMMSLMGFTGPIMDKMGTIYWNDAMELDPFKSFDIVAKFNTSQKQAFKNMILSVARKDNAILRLDVARQIFDRTYIR